MQAFAENLWIIDGPLVRDMGIWFPTRVVVARLSDGSLWVDSPVSMSFETLKRLTELGPVKYLVAATPRHVWRLESWHALFPEAELWAPRKTLLTLQKGRLTFTGTLGDAPPKSWSHDLDQLAFKGNPLGEEVIFFHKRSRTVILDDLIQSHPPAKGKHCNNALTRLSGVRPPGGVGLDIRLTFTNRRLARQSLEELMSWDFDRLIIAHGPCIEKDAKPAVEQAFRWLRH